MGLGRFELPTSPLSGVRSNQLSYRPGVGSQSWARFKDKQLVWAPASFRVAFSLKEVIQPHLPIRLPCYDFTPIIGPTFGGWLQKVTSPTSGVTNSRGVTGGVYKARERIHRGMLIHDY